MSQQPVPLVIEIGPGKGALTEHLLHRAERVIAVEVDWSRSYLRHRFRDSDHLTVVEGDVLTADLTQIAGTGVVAGNLPYYITSPILERVFRMADAWMGSMFLVQKEVAERLTASPGLARLRIFDGADPMYSPNP